MYTCVIAIDAALCSDPIPKQCEGIAVGSGKKARGIEATR